MCFYQVVAQNPSIVFCVHNKPPFYCLRLKDRSVVRLSCESHWITKLVLSRSDSKSLGFFSPKFRADFGPRRKMGGSLLIGLQLSLEVTDRRLAHFDWLKTHVWFNPTKRKQNMPVNPPFCWWGVGNQTWNSPDSSRKFYQNRHVFFPKTSSDILVVPSAKQTFWIWNITMFNTFGKNMHKIS